MCYTFSAREKACSHPGLDEAYHRQIVDQLETCSFGVSAQAHHALAFHNKMLQETGVI
jgi:hypothetical protein